jgi:hypothetical protein
LILEEPLAGFELDGIDAALELFRDRGILLEARIRVGLLAELPEQHGVSLLMADGAFATLFDAKLRLVSFRIYRSPTSYTRSCDAIETVSQHANLNFHFQVRCPAVDS